MGLTHVLLLHPRADGKKDRAVSIDVIGAVLRVVFDNEDHGVFPTWAVRDKLDGQAKRGIVVLDESLERPVGSVGIDVACAATVVVRVIQVDVLWKLADAPG